MNESRTSKGKLYLIPNLLGGDTAQIVPPYVLEQISLIRHFIVEKEREARRYLIKLGFQTPIDELTFFVLDKYQKDKNIGSFLQVAQEGKDIGLISDAGCPAIADPGALVVAAAHRKKLKIVPFVGPSSIVLSLMASGLNGQQFAFNGYLPIDKEERSRKIKNLDKLVQKEGSTQIFIETPYRNDKLLQDLIKVCNPNTRLCVACDVTLPTEYIFSQSIKEWKQTKVDLHKRPTVFLLGK